MAISNIRSSANYTSCLANLKGAIDLAAATITRIGSSKPISPEFVQSYFGLHALYFYLTNFAETPNAIAYVEASCDTREGQLQRQLEIAKRVGLSEEMNYCVRTICSLVPPHSSLHCQLPGNAPAQATHIEKPPVTDAPPPVLAVNFTLTKALPVTPRPTVPSDPAYARMLKNLEQDAAKRAAIGKK